MAIFLNTQVMVTHTSITNIFVEEIKINSYSPSIKFQMIVEEIKINSYRPSIKFKMINDHPISNHQIVLDQIQKLKRSLKPLFIFLLYYQMIR